MYTYSVEFKWQFSGESALIMLRVNTNRLYSVYIHLYLHHAASPVCIIIIRYYFRVNKKNLNPLDNYWSSKKKKKTLLIYIHTCVYKLYYVVTCVNSDSIRIKFRIKITYAVWNVNSIRLNSWLFFFVCIYRVLL